MVLRFSPAAAAAAAFALSSFPTPTLLGVHAYTAKGLGGIASSSATHNNPSSALVPSSALARRGGGRYGDYDDLPYGPPRPNDVDDYGLGPYDYGACSYFLVASLFVELHVFICIAATCYY